MVKTNSRHNDSVSTLGWGAGKKPEEAETELKFADGWMVFQCLQVYTARFDLLCRLLGTTGESSILRTENVERVRGGAGGSQEGCRRASGGGQELVRSGSGGIQEAVRRGSGGGEEG